MVDLICVSFLLRIAQQQTSRNPRAVSHTEGVLAQPAEPEPAEPRATAYLRRLRVPWSMRHRHRYLRCCMAVYSDGDSVRVRRNGQVHGRGRAPAIQFESPRSPTSSTRQGNSPKMARVSAVQREMEENGTKRPVFVCTEWSSTTAPTSFSVAASDGHSAWRLEGARPKPYPS